MSDLSMGTGNTASAVQTSLGKKIMALKLEDEVLTIELEDGSKLLLYDDGQHCSESRYMRTDDTLADYVGDLLTEIELRDAPDGVSEDGDCHEVQFLVVKTSSGELVMSSHNEHNGYYSGFSIEATLEGVDKVEEEPEHEEDFE